MCHFHAFWVGSNPTRNNFLRFLKQNNKEKTVEKSEKYRYLSEIFGKNRTNEISVHFSFRGSPKNDISAKYRPKKPKFLSMVVIVLVRRVVYHRGTTFICV